MFPEWLIFVAILWLVFGGRRWGGCGRGDYARERILEASARHRSRVRSRDRSEARRAETPALPQQPLEDRLRRDYVAGRLTVEEYETRLDDLYGGRR